MGELDLTGKKNLQLPLKIKHLNSLNLIKFFFHGIKINLVVFFMSKSCSKQRVECKIDKIMEIGSKCGPMLGIPKGRLASFGLHASRRIKYPSFTVNSGSSWRINCGK